ncbi:chemotaxis protein [Helicovermis profundi]|uniref:Stage 0 sporulation protein A homolog n=1 Tax=Helicovermis profundi TaxID=3065157 RepID=A0AAU9ESR7_9FIRM|nr:chemotaxis protein [Clostridia bacterium S502]
MKDDNGILLETGTGELEILHFIVKDEHYAINVVKVKEILEIENLSKVPNSHPSVAGISLIRGDVISIVDMKHVLENEKNEDIKKSMVLVCEFNKIKVAFAIDEVLGIARIKWSDIHKPSAITSDTLVIGNINLKDEIIMLLDFEKIVMDISPAAGINVDRMADVEENSARKDVKIVLADDSPLIRTVLKNTLSMAGFDELRFFDDGKQALDYIMKIYDAKGKDFINDINLLITDIEMPQLDGHTLTRTIKEHKDLKKLPVIIFSSLITGDLRHKGEAVGADAQLSKPEVAGLVELIDSIMMVIKNK